MMRMNSSHVSGAALGVWLGLVPGCYHGLSDAGEAGGAAADGGVDEGPTLRCESLGVQALRRISSEQYTQILRDLLPGDFGKAALAVSKFPETRIDAGFSSYATANTVSTNESIAIEDNAEAIAAVLADDFETYAPQLVPCLSSGLSDADIDACMDGFVAEFGAQAFRRPLTEAETETLVGLYDAVAGADGARAGLVAVLQYFVQAPALLYVAEPSEESADSGKIVALAPDAVAVRLGLLFANGSPDAELHEAVAQGRLSTREDVEAQARRLLEAPEAARAFATFHHEWMQGFALQDAPRDHPLWSERSGEALANELRAFATWFFEETDGTFATLMTTDAFVADDALTEIYSAGGGGPRRGLLTTAAAMASRAHEGRTSLIERGSFIRSHILCTPPPPFPGDIDIDGTLAGYEDLPTARERFEPLMLEPSCSGCHASMNPLGFPFEVFDWVGAYRSQENGVEIDTSVKISIGQLSGEFADAADLMEAIAETDEARDCYVNHWFRYAMGRPESPADKCALDAIKARFADSDGDVRELLVALATSDAFLFRVAGGGE